MRVPSNPQLRSARKELLLVRAELERIELGDAIGEVRETVTRFGWLCSLVPIIMGLRTAKGKGQGGRFWQHPWVSSITALLCAKPLGAKAKPVFRLVGLALTVWETWRMWRQFRQNNAQSSAREEET